MTEEERKERWDAFLAKRKSEISLLTHNGAFTEEQAEILQAYLDQFFYRKN